MSCAETGQMLGQLFMGAGLLVIVSGVIIFWVGEARAKSRIRIIRAERGLYEEVGSLSALDEQMWRRK